jgi:HD-GYP domain-containing protein (c-di-GMP phosphodiesterase class II)
VITLENKLQEAYIKYEINPKIQIVMTRFLNRLLQKDKATHDHSIRVGLIAPNVAKYLDLNVTPSFYTGIFHDVGKLLIPAELLRKTENFTEKDYETMKQHAIFSYQILKKKFSFSADIVVRHHKYRKGEGYPEILPKYKHPYSEATRSLIERYAVILSLVDFYDAATTRINDKHGEKRYLSNVEVKNLMIEKHPDYSSLIYDLYANGILGHDLLC